MTNHFKFNENKNFSIQYIKNIIYKELINELILRIEWEESKVLDVVKNLRLQNSNFDVNKWMYKYIDHENNSRCRWHKFLIKIIQMSMERIKSFVDEETVMNINNIDYADFNIPISSYEIYDDDRYDYLFNFNLNNIQLLNGLWRIVENGNIITTSKLCNSYIGSISFKSVTTTTIPEPICIGKFDNNTNKWINGHVNSNIVKTKKNYPRRKKQMEKYFGVDVDDSPVEIMENKISATDIILKDYNKCSDDTRDRKIVRDMNRSKYFTNVMRNETLVNKTLVNKPPMNKTLVNNVKKDVNVKRKMFAERNFDIPEHIDMTKYELVDKDIIFELKNNFSFSTVFSYDKYYALRSSLNTITRYYEKCKEKGKMLQEYINEIYNKISMDDAKNRTNNLKTLFKNGKIDCDVYNKHIFTL